MNGRAARAVLVALAALGPRVAAAADCTRPTDAEGVSGYSYGSVAVQSFGNERVLVWYTTTGTHAVNPKSARDDGVPTDVVEVAQVTADALGSYEAMGYRTPPSDEDATCGSNGGDARLDVYLVRMTGADGMAVPEYARCVSEHQCSSFLIAKSNYAATYGSADLGIRTVLPHELFHAVQNAYDTELDRFWAEGTAQWATKQLYPELTDLERNLSAFLSQPSRSLDAPPSGVTAGFLYGSAIWPVFLAERHGDDIVRAILEREATDSFSAIQASDAQLGTLDSSIASEFPLFAAWNAGTGARAGTGGYALAQDYPEVPVSELSESAQDISSGLSSFYFHFQTDRRLSFTLDTDAKRNTGVLVPLEAGVARLDRIAALPTAFDGEGLIVVSGITTAKTDAKFRIGFGDAPSEPAESGGGCALSRTPVTGSSYGAVALSLLAIAVVLARRAQRAV